MNIIELEGRLELLENRVKAQEKELMTLKDIEAIKKLQNVEHMMYQEIVDCFSDSPDVVLNWLEGQWLGKEGVKKYFAFRQKAPLTFSHQVMQLAGVVDIDPDGKTASGRWYAFGGIFFPLPEGMRRSFVTGIYENRYIKEDGVWKILKVKWVIPYAVSMPGEWRMPEDVNRPYLAGQWRGPAPDVPIDREDMRYVTGYIFPFHYKHPVTGRPTSEDEKNARLKEMKQGTSG
ncbi:MAG: nuclear transport factor 2 family protein [Dehalococcoidales bacterium]